MMLDRPKTTLICIQPENVGAVWAAVFPLIDKAYEAIEEPTPNLLKWLKEKKGLLWLAISDDHEIKGAATTSLVLDRYGALYCRICAAGGTGGLELWQTHINGIEDYARAEGCYKTSFEGRQGWGRVLAGYVPVTVCFERRL